jgi:cytochrome P450
MPELAEILPSNFFFTEEYSRDPHAVLHEIRKRGPVQRIDFPPDEPAFLVVDHDLVYEALSDPRLAKDLDKGPAWFRERVLENSVVLATNMMVTDPPDHTRLRRPAARAFTARRLERLRPRIQEIADDLIDRFPSSGELDLINELALPLPVRVICELLGVPVESRPQFRDWSATLLLSVTASSEGEIAERRKAASAAITEFFTELIAARRARPVDDLMSDLLLAQRQGEGCSDEELISTLVLLLIAGHETTVHLIGNGVAALLTNADQLQLLKDDPDRIPAAVEEFLRYDGPIERATTRFAAEDLTIADTFIPKGSFVHLSIAAANRDPGIFSCPGRLDVTRTDQRHIAFGHGIHFCPGAPLGRIEGQIVFETLLRRVPGLALAVPPEELDWQQDTTVVRGLRTLRVRTGGPVLPAGA